MGKIADLIGSAYENWYGETVFLDCGDVYKRQAFLNISVVVTNGMTFPPV